MDTICRYGTRVPIYPAGIHHLGHDQGGLWQTRQRLSRPGRACTVQTWCSVWGSCTLLSSWLVKYPCTWAVPRQALKHRLATLNSVRISPSNLAGPPYLDVRFSTPSQSLHSLSPGPSQHAVVPVIIYLSPGDRQVDEIALQQHSGCGPGPVVTSPHFRHPSPPRPEDSPQPPHPDSTTHTPQLAAVQAHSFPAVWSRTDREKANQHYRGPRWDGCLCTSMLPDRPFSSPRKPTPTRSPMERQ